MAMGSTFGIGAPVLRKEEFMISSNVGRRKGSKFKIRVMSYLAGSEIGTLSGKPY